MADLTGKNILIASGPTVARLDHVRYIANRSSGRMGSTIAAELCRRGAKIIQLAGVNSYSPQQLFPDQYLSSIQLMRFETVDELKQLLKNNLQEKSIDAVIMAAAVLDYVPAEVIEGKKSSKEDEWVIKLKRGEKIIEQIQHWSPDTLLVGFKLESNISFEELIARADDLMKRSGARAVVANYIEDVGIEKHRGYLVRRDARGGVAIAGPFFTREEIARRLAEILL